MKRKYADYPNWKKVLEKGYLNKYFNEEDFKGNVSLLTAIKVKERVVIQNKNEDFILFDDGFKWLEFYSDENKNVSMSVSINDKDEIIEWYFDVAKDVNTSKEGIPYIDDLYLDVILYPNGEIKIIDQDELKDALNNKEITKKEYDLACFVASNLVEKIIGKEDKIKEFTYKYFDLLKNKN